MQERNIPLVAVYRCPLERVLDCKKIAVNFCFSVIYQQPGLPE